MHDSVSSVVSASRQGGDSENDEVDSTERFFMSLKSGLFGLLVRCFHRRLLAVAF
jgi:hypothetical protein